MTLTEFYSYVYEIYFYFSYLIMGLLVAQALAHRITVHTRIRRLPRVDVADLVTRIQRLPMNRPANWHRSLTDHWTAHPASEVILWATEMPYRLGYLDWHEDRLASDIKRVFGDLEAGIQRNIAIASPMGFIFTVLGLMLFAFSSQDNLSIQTLLQALGPALGTTALGNAIMVSELRLLHGRFAQEHERLMSTGTQLLDALHDRIAARRWHQAQIIQRRKELRDE